MQKFLPVISWLPQYRKAWLKDDLIAGVTVGVMLIPQGMAYALIAGLPPEYGLYAAVVPLIIYAILGTSRHLAVGPVALIALLVASAVSPLANSPEEYITLSVLLALMIGVIQFVFGLLRMGFLVNLLSHPVLSGFVSAAAIVIGLSQLHHLLGVESVSGGLHEIAYGIGTQFTNIHIWTLLIGLAAIALIFIIKKTAPKIPGSLIAVVAGVALIFITGLNQAGVSIVGEIPEGLPAFSVPVIEWSSVTALIPMALAISLVAYMESIAVAKAIQQKDGNYQVDANQELIALGAANIGGSFFQSFPVTGGFSRTAVNFDSGARTGLASVISAMVVAITLLFLTPFFYYLPHAVLAAIIMAAVYGLIDVKEFRKLWQLGHYDRYMYLATFGGTLFIGIEEGILLGVVLSVLMLVYRSARPHHTVLGRLPGTSIYRSINRYETDKDDGMLVFRFDAPLHFANAEYFRDQVYELIDNQPQINLLILDFNGVDDIDSTGIDELLEVIEHLNNKGIDVKMAQVKGPVRDLISKGSSTGEEIKFYMTIEDAAESAEKSGSARTDIASSDTIKKGN